MKTSRLVLAPAVAVALTGLAGAPALAQTSSPATVPPTEVCAQEDGQQSSNDSEADSSVPDESDPQATLAHAQVSRADIANNKKGIGFSGTGFTPDQKATVTVVGTDGTEYSPEKKLTVDEKGEVSGTYFFTVTEGAKVPVGEYSLYLTDLKSEKDSSKVSFEVVAQADDVDDADNSDSGNSDSDDSNEDCKRATAPADDGDKDKDEEETPSETPSESKTPSETPSESKTPSETPSESDTPDPSESDEKSEDKSDEKNDDKSDDERAKNVVPGPAKKAPTDDDKSGEDEQANGADDAKKTDGSEADNDGKSADANESDDAKSDGADDDKSKESEDKQSEQPSTKSEAPETTGPASPGTDEKKAPAAAKQSLYIDPTEISSEDFLNKGIKLGVSGAQPGEKVTITVEHAQGKVDRYTMTKQADSEGKVTFGVQAKVKAVLGTYKVTAQAESFDEPQGGTFTVLTNGTAVEDGNSSNSAGNDLPRTGAEMTGLALGVGLLAVGAAAVILTRRRMNASDDPAEF